MAFAMALDRLEAAWGQDFPSMEPGQLRVLPVQVFLHSFIGLKTAIGLE